MDLPVLPRYPSSPSRLSMSDKGTRLLRNKYDKHITEEQVRLDAHLNYFILTMKKDSPNGKKLAFIGQEIGREINTIGSKSSDAKMQKIVVQMKDELEKIKEQLLNIL